MTGTGCLQYPWRSWVGGWSSDGSARRWPRVARVSRCVSSWCRGAPGGRRCLCMPVGEHVRHAGGRVDGDVLSHWGGRSLGGRDALGLHARPWGVGARWDAGTRTCDEVLGLALGRHVFSKRVRPVFRAKGAAHTSRERRGGRDVSASPPPGAWHRPTRILEGRSGGTQARLRTRLWRRCWTLDGHPIRTWRPSNLG